MLHGMYKTSKCISKREKSIIKKKGINKHIEVTNKYI